jgi:hypothetical protein
VDWIRGGAQRGRSILWHQRARNRSAVLSAHPRIRVEGVPSTRHSSRVQQRTRSPNCRTSSKVDPPAEGPVPPLPSPPAPYNPRCAGGGSPSALTPSQAWGPLLEVQGFHVECSKRPLTQSSHFGSPLPDTSATRIGDPVLSSHTLYTIGECVAEEQPRATAMASVGSSRRSGVNAPSDGVACRCRSAECLASTSSSCA